MNKAVGNQSAGYKETANNDKEIYRIDEKIPETIHFPEDESDISEILKDADDRSASLIIWGGGTTVRTGFPVDSYSQALDVKNLSKIIEYEPADLLITVEPGATIKSISEAAATHNQFLALNPPSCSEATIGGVLASNATGYLQASYGTARDMTLGIKFLRTDGSKVKSGGKVTKNVAGYDLTKLLIGSWGTIGVITEISIRVKPLPEMNSTLIAGFETIVACFEFANKVINSHYTPAFMVIVNKDFADNILERNFGSGNHHYFIVMGMDGLEETARWQRSMLSDVIRANSKSFLDEIPSQEDVRIAVENFASHKGKEILLKVSLPLSQSEELFYRMSELESQLQVEIMCQFEIGICYINVKTAEIQQEALVDNLQSLRSFISELGGHLTVETAPLSIKNVFPVWPEFGGEFIMQGIKKKFDPKNILNPNRFIKV